MIRKIDPWTGEVIATIPAPGEGGDSGLAWAEGSLWVGQHRGRRIHQVDHESGKVLRTIETDRELWRKLGDDGLREAAYRGGC